MAVPRERDERSGEEWAQLLFERNPQPMWVLDRETLAFLAINEAAAALYGHTREEFLRMTLADVCPPGDIPALEQLEGLARHRRRDGSVIVVSVLGANVDFGGRPAYLAAPRDVTAQLRAQDFNLTERQHADEALRQSERRYRALAETAHDNIFIVDRDGRMQYVNTAAAGQLGRESGQIVGKLIDELFPADIAARFRANIRRVVETRTDLYVEGQARYGDRIGWIGTWLTPNEGEAGAVESVLGVSRDITERVELLERERSARELAETLSQATLALTQKADLEPVLETLLDHLAGLVPYDSASVMLVEGGRLAVHAMRGYERFVVAGATRQLVFELASYPIFDDMLKSREPFVVPDSVVEPRWQRVAGAEHVRSWLGVPLVQHGRTIGLFSMDKTEPDFFTEEHVRLAQALAPTAATAIENARLLHDLRGEKARLQLAIDASNLGPWDWDAQTNAVYFSPEWKRQIGYQEHEIPGRYEEWESRLHPEDREPTLAALQAYMEGRRPDYEVEFRLRHKDGSYRWIYTCGEVLRGADGKPERMLGCHLDISERKGNEEQLRRSEEKYRTLFERAPDGVFLTDAGGHFVDASSTGLRLLGYTRDELLGMGVADVVVAAEATRVGAELLEVVAGRPHHREWVASRKDGSVFTGEVTGSLMPDGSVLAVVRDITERKHAEEALRASADLFRTLVSASGQSAWRYRRGHSMLDQLDIANHRWWCEFTGQTEAERTARDGMGWLDAVHGEDRAVALRAWSDLDTLTGSESIEAEYRVRRRDDRWRWLAIRGVPHLRDARAVVTEWAGTITDITERKLAEHERDRLLEEASLGRRQLEALSRRLVVLQENERQAIARELHDQIGQLLTGLKLLAESGRGKDELLEVVGELIGRVRGLSLDLRPPMLDTLGLVPALLWHVDRYTAQTGVRVDFRELGQRRRYASDTEIAAFRIVQEALTNVVRHAGVREAAILIEAVDERLRLRVEDQGSGFDPARVTSATTIGLTGMQERARLLGGRFSIDSRVGRGTRVEAELPATDRGQVL